MDAQDQKNTKPVKRKTTASTKKIKNIDIQKPTSFVEEEVMSVSVAGTEAPYIQEPKDSIHEPATPKVRKVSLLTKRTFVVSIVIIAVLIGSMFYFHWFGVGLSAQQRAQIELKAAVTAVGKLILLPKNETPALAKITNAKKLAVQQPFFTNAKDGDELLIFQKSSRAIIYSPSRNIIVNVGPIQRPSKPSAVATPRTLHTPQNVSVEVLNGSNKSGIAASSAKIISSLGDKVVGVTDAKKSDYKKTIVIDIARTSASAAAANTIAKKLNATVTQSLPNGESNSKADVMVILGADASNL